jgi:fanconi anemia group I protein
VVHQMLGLASKGPREAILSSIVTLFDRREAALGAAPPAAELRCLREVEGAALLHLDVAAKHDSELGVALLRCLTAAGPCPPPFLLAAAFALAGQRRLEPAVLGTLCKAMATAHENDVQRAAAAGWLPKDSRAVSQKEALASALLRSVRAAAGVQAGLAEPMLRLATVLLEGGGGAACADVGSRLILEVFKAHRESRRTTLSTLCDRLIGAVSEDEAAPFVRALAGLVAAEPALVAPHTEDLRPLIQHLPFLPPAAALAALLASRPLRRRDPAVRDQAVMALRKAMFGRELSSRLLAARGFLILIAEELEEEGAGEGRRQGGTGGTQAGCSTQAPALSQRAALTQGPGSGTLLHELMGFLRRCLAQQPGVRAAVYAGLPALLDLDTAAAEPAAEPLLVHLCQFIERDEALSPPLKLEACVRMQVEGGGARVVEPLHRLLACVASLLRMAPVEGEGGGGEEEEEATPALRRCFASLRRRLASSTLEDFEVGCGVNHIVSV